MAPSADFSFDQTANDETFVMTNMVPQKPNLNRDSWRRLEDQVRKWACGEGQIIVISGPVIDEDLRRLPSGIPIPNLFFKIVIDDTPPRKALAFLYSQSDRGDQLRKNLVRLQEIEKRARIDFHPELPLEDRSVFDQPANIDSWESQKCG